MMYIKLDSPKLYFLKEYKIDQINGCRLVYSLRCKRYFNLKVIHFRRAFGSPSHYQDWILNISTDICILIATTRPSTRVQWSTLSRTGRNRCCLTKHQKERNKSTLRRACWRIVIQRSSFNGTVLLGRKTMELKRERMRRKDLLCCHMWKVLLKEVKEFYSSITSNAVLNQIRLYDRSSPNLKIRWSMKNNLGLFIGFPVVSVVLSTLARQEGR